MLPYAAFLLITQARAIKLQWVAWEGASMDYHNVVDEYFQSAHFVPYHAYLEVVPVVNLVVNLVVNPVAYLAAYPELFHETCPGEDLGACLVAYPGASSQVFEPYEAMHDTRAKSYLNPVLPCYTPCRFQIVAEGEERRHYTGGEGTRDGATHGEVTRDVA